MAYEKGIIVIQNDTSFDIEFEVRDSDDAVVDLTGATIVLNMRLLGTTTKKISAGSVTIVTATDGTCKYTAASGDFDTVGLYELELQITNGSKVISAQDMTINVKGEF